VNIALPSGEREIIEVLAERAAAEIDQGAFFFCKNIRA